MLEIVSQSEFEQSYILAPSNLKNISAEENIDVEHLGILGIREEIYKQFPSGVK